MKTLKFYYTEKKIKNEKITHTYTRSSSYSDKLKLSIFYFFLLFCYLSLGVWCLFTICISQNSSVAIQTVDQWCLIAFPAIECLIFIAICFLLHLFHWILFNDFIFFSQIGGFQWILLTLFFIRIYV